MRKLNSFKAKALALARSGYFYGLPPLEFELSFEEGFNEAESGLINPRLTKNWNVSARSQERSIKPHDLVAVACLSPAGAINCKDYAVSSLCKSWKRTEHKQPKSTAAVGASSPSGVPRIGICDHNAVRRVFSRSVPLV